MPIEFFSDQDRKFIRDWKAQQQKALDNANITANSWVRISVGTNRDSEFNDYGDIDDQVVQIKASKSTWKDNFRKILKAKLKKPYDRKFESQQLGYNSF
ncbi:MAG: hypothetical protein AAF212_01670 [Verrucomicrobiota bacterium]